MWTLKNLKKKLNKQGKITFLSFYTGGRTLQILNAQKEDAGRYTCVATNEAGETLKHYEVKVYGKNPANPLACKQTGYQLFDRRESSLYCQGASENTTLAAVPPQINKNDIPGEGLAPKEVKIRVNNTLTLECVAQAFPTPALQWYKDGQVGISSHSLYSGRTRRSLLVR